MWYYLVTGDCTIKSHVSISQRKEGGPPGLHPTSHSSAINDSADVFLKQVVLELDGLLKNASSTRAQQLRQA